MSLQCAWCHTIIDQGGDEPQQEEPRDGICTVCAARVLTEDALQRIDQHFREMLRMQALLLEMVGDLYEVACSLAPKAGVGIQPAANVRQWQRERGE